MIYAYFFPDSSQVLQFHYGKSLNKSIKVQTTGWLPWACSSWCSCLKRLDFVSIPSLGEGTHLVQNYPVVKELVMWPVMLWGNTGHAQGQDMEVEADSVAARITWCSFSFLLSSEASFGFCHGGTQFLLSSCLGSWTYVGCEVFWNSGSSLWHCQKHRANREEHAVLLGMSCCDAPPLAS